MTSSFSFIGGPTNGKAFTDWTQHEQSVASELMTNEGLIEVNNAYIVEADHNLKQLTVKRVVDGVERCLIPIRFVEHSICKYVTIEDPTDIAWNDIQLTVSAIHPHKLSCIDHGMQLLLSGDDSYVRDNSAMSFADALARIEIMLHGLRQNIPFILDERELQIAREKLAPFYISIKDIIILGNDNRNSALSAMPPQLPAPPTAAQRQSINMIARRTRASIAAEGTLATTATVPEGDSTANAENEGMAMFDDHQDLDGPPETGEAVTVGAGQANAAMGLPIYPPPMFLTA